VTAFTEHQGLPEQQGLRERKKARTRASLREHALRLFREQGYQATTIEQIAAAAEVSPSTFFRYYPTKEDLVLQDEFDARVFEAFERQPLDVPPIAAIRAALQAGFATLTPAELDELALTSALTHEVPEIRARSLEEFNRTIRRMTEALAKRTGRTADDIAVRAFTGAVFGIIMTVTMHGEPGELAVGPDMFERIDDALALLAAGLPL
jgi:AcrR family transcriptional regulator